ncbi:MAG: hypothetical protein RL488_1105 [Actinomycetota bacterium]|jgi:hypothetical protein
MSFIKMFTVAITDLNFKQSVGVQISKIFYLLSLVWHGLSALGALGFGLFTGITMAVGTETSEYDSYYDEWYTTGHPGNPLGILLALATLVVVPLVTFVGVLVSRYVFEWYNAVIHTAENTKRQA